MNSTEKPLVYVILGAAGSGRREVLLDLIAGGFGDDDRPVVLLAAAEPAAEIDAKLPGVARWVWTQAGSIEADLPEGATHIFFVTDGRRSPVDQMEAFKAWVEMKPVELGRVLTVINCQLAAQHPSLRAWYEACVHFSDVALLNRREGVENKWLSDFRGFFDDQFVPCLFEFVKGGRVKNPALILDPQARRMTHVFDDELEWLVVDAEGSEDDGSDAEIGVEEEVQVAREEEPYFVRDAAGRRAKRIVEIAEFLPKIEPAAGT
jgi:hypothetical protein